MAGRPPNRRDPLLPYEAPDLSPELRDYLLAVLRAARPSKLRTQALAAFAAASTPEWAEPVDWQALELEAARRGITLAELIAGGDPDAPGSSAA